MPHNAAIYKPPNAAFTRCGIGAICPPHTELHYVVSVPPAHRSLRIRGRTEQLA